MKGKVREAVPAVEPGMATAAVQAAEVAAVQVMVKAPDREAESVQERVAALAKVSEQAQERAAAMEQETA